MKSVRLFVVSGILWIFCCMVLFAGDPGSFPVQKPVFSRPPSFQNFRFTAGKKNVLSFPGGRGSLVIPEDSLTAMNLFQGGIRPGSRGFVQPGISLETGALKEQDSRIRFFSNLFRFGPHGLQFGKPALLTLPYDCPPGFPEEFINLYCYNEEEDRWEVLEKVSQDTAGNTVTAAIEHFSNFVAGQGSYRIEEGVSPNGSYFNNRNEIVDPFQGTLHVQRTDIDIPARGTNLGLSSCFSSDGYFLHYNSGLHYSSQEIEQYGAYPYAFGWRFALPTFTKNRTLQLPSGTIYDLANAISCKLKNDTKVVCLEGYRIYNTSWEGDTGHIFKKNWQAYSRVIEIVKERIIVTYSVDTRKKDTGDYLFSDLRVIMPDGKVYSFYLDTNDGRVSSISDSISGANRLSFFYETYTRDKTWLFFLKKTEKKTRLKSITHSDDRRLEFSYSGTNPGNYTCTVSLTSLSPRKYDTTLYYDTVQPSVPDRSAGIHGMEKNPTGALLSRTPYPAKPEAGGRNSHPTIDDGNAYPGNTGNKNSQADLVARYTVQNGRLVKFERGSGVAAEKTVYEYSGNRIPGGDTLTVRYPSGGLTSYAFSQVYYLRRYTSVSSSGLAASPSDDGGEDSHEYDYYRKPKVTVMESRERGDSSRTKRTEFSYMIKETPVSDHSSTKYDISPARTIIRTKDGETGTVYCSEEIVFTYSPVSDTVPDPVYRGPGSRAVYAGDATPSEKTAYVYTEIVPEYFEPSEIIFYKGSGLARQHTTTCTYDWFGQVLEKKCTGSGTESSVTAYQYVYSVARDAVESTGGLVSKLSPPSQPVFSSNPFPNHHSDYRITGLSLVKGKAELQSSGVYRLTYYSYDGDRNLLGSRTVCRDTDSVTTDRTTRYFYDSQNRLIAALQPEGEMIYLTYGESGYLSSYIVEERKYYEEQTDAGEGKQKRMYLKTFSYDRFGRPLRIQEKIYEYYLLHTTGLPISPTVLGPCIERFVSAPLFYTWDGRDRLLSVRTEEDAGGTGSGGSLLREYRYDDTLRTVEAEDAIGRLRRTTYDGLDRLVREETFRPSAGSGSAGSQRSTDIRISEARYTYHPAYQQNIVTRTVYSSPTKSVVYTTEYDLLGREQENRIGGVTVQKTAYRDDENARNISRWQLNSGGVSRVALERIELDCFGRTKDVKRWSKVWDQPVASVPVLTPTTPADITTSYTYNNAGDVISVSTASGSKGESFTVGYGYNSAGEREITEYGNGKEKTLYDRNGRVRKTVDRNGNTITLEYDAMGRIFRETAEGTNPAAGYSTVSYHSYPDLHTRVRTVTRSLISGGIVASTSFEYDSMGRSTAIYPTIGSSLSYGILKTYDNASNMSSLSLRERGTTKTLSYEYLDKSDNEVPGSILGVKYGSEVIARTESTYWGTLGKIRYDNGTFTTNYSDFDPLLRPRKISNDTFLDFNLSYTYDLQGNIVEMNGKAYRYDGLDQLVEVPYDSVSYSYDWLGNRKTAARGTERQQFLADPQIPIRIGSYTDTEGTHRCIYDRQGNLTEETVETKSGTIQQTYVYNAYNQLVEIRKGSVSVETCEYDASGKRIKKVVMENGKPVKTVISLFDGENLLYEETLLSSSDDGSPSAPVERKELSVWLSGLNTAKLLWSSLRPVPVLEYHLLDHLGSRIKTVGSPAPRPFSISIRARGSGMTIVSPKMILCIDRKLVAEWTVANTAFQDFSWNGNIVGEGVVSIVFPNQYISGNVNSNLHVDSFVVNGLTVTPDSPGVRYDYGLYETGGCFDSLNVAAGQSTMTRSGALHYGVSNEIPYSPFGESAGSPAEYSFTGKKLDAETGLVYFNARYYNPATGRFIQPDPAKDGVNWYVYCSNNPLKYVDPTGMMPENDDLDDGTWKRIPGGDWESESDRKEKVNSIARNKIIRWFIDNLESVYNSQNDCDVWIQNGFLCGGKNLAPVWGLAKTTDAQGHFIMLKDNLRTVFLAEGLYVGIVDWKGSRSGFDHVYAIEMGNAGIRVYSHGGSSNDSSPYFYKDLSTFLSRTAWSGTHRFWNPW